MTKRLRRGGRLGKYRLERMLGHGGSAAVWRARDTIEGRRVALKVVLPEVVEQFGREAIEAEARMAAQLDHPRVVSIRNADWIESHFVLVTDLARGSLDQYAGARRSPRVAVSILADVAQGLSYAHSRGVIHRDIKPANIFLYEGRRARLGDFGTARLAPAETRLQTEVGTFGYMAPEQAYGRARFASDVFALSLTAYELFAGQLPGWPFEWPLEGNPRFVTRCPKALQPVLQRGLELDLSRRWVDGIEFERAITRAIAKSDAGEQEKGRRSTTHRKKPPRASPPPDPFALERRWFRNQYGKTFDARFDCHACDGPISESMSHCPWCGSSCNSFVEVTSFPLVCPDCERGVRPEWGACPTCTKGRLEPSGKPVPGRTTADRFCRKPGCGAPIHRFMHYCPACKAKIAKPWKIEGLDACERCHWPVGPRWRFCAWCGRTNKRALAVAAKRGARSRSR